MKYFTHRSYHFFTILATAFFVLCAESAWGGETVLFSTDFSSASWSGITSICNSSNAANETHNGITFHSYNSSAKPFTVNQSAGTMTWCNNNLGNNYWIAIPVTGVNESMTITVDNGTTATRFKYAYKQETSISGNPGSGSNNSGSATDPATVTISGLTKSDYVVYLGRQGSGLTQIKSITITTPAPVFLKPNSNWLEKDGSGVDPRFAVYYFGSSGDGWVSMTLADGGCGPVYKANIPAGYDKCIFCRMNGAAAENNWSNKYNQTGDLTVPTGDAIFYAVPDGWWDTSGDSYWQQEPLSVCVSGTWLAFKGETITLTATSAGATNFQWYKNGAAIAGATSATYTKTNCTIDDAGTYTCQAWATSGHTTTSSGHDVKIPYLEYRTPPAGEITKVPFERGNPSHEYAHCTVYPGVAWGYELTVNDGFNRHGNSGTKERSNSTDKWTMETSPEWCRWNTDKEGTYHFYLNFSNSVYEPLQLNIVYPLMSQEGGIPIYMEKTPAMVSEGWTNISCHNRR